MYRINSPPNKDNNRQNKRAKLERIKLMGRRIYTTKATDGKVFEGTDVEALEAEIDAYEADLAFKKQKKEAELKEKEEKRKDILSQIADHTNKLNDLCVEYSKLSNGNIYFWLVNGRLMCDASDLKSNELLRLLNGFL